MPVDRSRLPAVRARIESALDDLRIACKILRRAGMPDSANDLMRTVKHGLVWTQKDGILDCLEKGFPDEESN